MDMPTAEDYIRAVQNPQVAFHRPRLRQARFDVHPLLGIPMPASGTTAIVFKATVGGKSQALRFLTRPDAASQPRYTALNRYFADRGLTRDVATSEWIEDAITVNGRTWPMLQMQWVEGRTLNHYVEDLVEAGDTGSIGSLADAWRGLVRRIQAARFAHGDLQHGNVMVEEDGTLRLVDFDSAWIEPFAGSARPTETGHRNYQRPSRPWGPWMDTFPGLVIYLSLLALARDPKTWNQLHTGENLLFRAEDFEPPHQTQAWWQIARLGDHRLGAMADRLKMCCAPAWPAATDLETVLATPLPWWARTRTAVVPQPVPARPIAAPQPAPANASTAPGPWWSGPVPAVPAGKSKNKSENRPLGEQKPRSLLSMTLISWVVWLVVAVALVAQNPTGYALGAAGALIPAAATFVVLAAWRGRKPKHPGRPR